jgi:steroid delta-isomerase-like uncharacterized protein
VNTQVEDNKQLVRRVFAEIVNGADLSLADRLFSADFMVHSSGRPSATRGPDGLRQFVTALRGAFPDLRLTIDDQIGEGEKVVTRYTIEGTQAGPLQGHPPTNARVVWTGITIHRISNGRIAESWVELDQLGLFRQLGAT